MGLSGWTVLKLQATLLDTINNVSHSVVLLFIFRIEAQLLEM